MGSEVKTCTKVVGRTRSSAFTYLSEDDHVVLQSCVAKIMKLLRIDTEKTPIRNRTEEDADESTNVSKLLQLEVPANTKELVIFAISNDGQVQTVTADGGSEPPFGCVRIFSEMPTKVKANTLFTLRQSETSITRRSNLIQSLAANDKDYANILTSLGSKMEIITEPNPCQQSFDDDGVDNIADCREDEYEDENESEEENKIESKEDSIKLDLDMEEIKDDIGFFCRICDNHFETGALLRSHYQTHLLSYWCRTCNAGFITDKHLLAHQKKTGHNYFQCDVCPKGFTRKSALLLHKRTQHKFEYFCDICNRSFVSLRSFSQHKQMHINKPTLLSKGPCKVLRYYKCMGCEERFTDVGSLQNHQCPGKPTKENNESAEESQPETSENEKSMPTKRKRVQKFSYATTRAKRMRFKTELKTGITCSQCNRDFITQRALRRHQLHHIEFRCKKCGSALKSQNELDEHSTKPCECRCPHCGRTFKKYRELQRHEVIHQEYRPFECETCNSKFPTEQKLRAHKQIHEEKKNLCHLCSRTFTFRQHLTRHLKAHARGEPRRMNKTFLYHCSICSSSFHAVANLREHYDTKHRLPSFRCVNCQVRVTTYGELQNHFRDVHKGILINCCRLCGDAFTEKKDCNQHALEHEAQVCAPLGDVVPTEENSETEIILEKRVSYLFSCTQCKQMFATHMGLISHNQIHYMEPPFKCLTCDQSVNSAQELEEHLPTHETSVELESCPKCSLYVANLKLHMRQHVGRFQCRDCGKCLKTKQGLTVHSFLHTGEKPFLCSDCGMQFNNSGKLISHRRIHGDTGGNAAGVPVRHSSFTCSMCRQKFWRPSAFLLHLYGYYREPCSVKRHVCVHCQREFVKKSNLTNHLRMHNETKGSMKKEFSCNKCNRTFSTKAHQIIHTQTHDTEDLICPICSKSFTSLVCLQVHMRTHTGECQSCHICKKQFAALKYLKKHMLSHSGERYRVKCSLCDVMFPSQKACLRHLRDIHTEATPGICDSCGFGFASNEDLQEHIANCKKPTEVVENPAEIAMDVVAGLEQPVAELDARAILETSDAVIQICSSEDQQVLENENGDVAVFQNEQTILMDLPVGVDGSRLIPATSFVCSADDNLYYEVVFQS